MPVEQSSAVESLSLPMVNELVNCFSEPSAWICARVKFAASLAERIKLRVGSTEIFSETVNVNGRGVPKVLVFRSSTWTPLLLRVESPMLITAVLLLAFSATPQLRQLPPLNEAVPLLPL